MDRDDKEARINLRVHRQVKARLEDEATKRNVSQAAIVMQALAEFWHDARSATDPTVCLKCSQTLPLDQRRECVCDISELRYSRATHCAVCGGYVPFDKRGSARLSRDPLPEPGDITALPPELRPSPNPFRRVTGRAQAPQAHSGANGHPT